jgi:hypothetical protein
MTAFRTAMTCGFTLATMTFAFPALAQESGANCILAGRITSDQRWAPRLAGVQLLAEGGRAVSAASKPVLAGVRQVRLTQPALLSRCDGNRELTHADDLPPFTKGGVPAASAGPGLLAVESVSFPRLRAGGEVVELKLTVPPNRVVMLTK